jgi:hypothetical protein
VQYLTVQESLRRLRAAGMETRERALRSWIQQRKLQDVLVLGHHTYIYDEELEALIRSERH